MFKSGIMPAWEDDICGKGSTLKITLVDKNFGIGLDKMNELWKALTLDLVA